MSTMPAKAMKTESTWPLAICSFSQITAASSAKMVDVEESREIYEVWLEENGKEVPEAYTMKMWREKLEIEEKRGNR